MSNDHKDLRLRERAKTCSFVRDNPCMIYGGPIRRIGAAVIRLIVCVDVEAKTLEEAYARVHQGMTASGLSWESSDEWYDHDGNRGQSKDLDAACIKYLSTVKDS